MLTRLKCPIKTMSPFTAPHWVAGRGVPARYCRRSVISYLG